MPRATTPANRVVPASGVPGPITAMAKLRRGELGSDALERIGAAVLPADDPRTQPTGRRGRPRKLPRQLAAIIAMRTEGLSDKQIAQRLDLAVTTVRSILWRARKDLQLSDIVDRVEHRAVPTAVDNLIEGLDMGDKDYTLATLKGVGVFRNHSAVKQEAQVETTNVLRVEIVMPEIPEGVAIAATAVGAVIGVPRGAPASAAPVIDVPPVTVQENS